jgi:hypothetical protein
MYSPLFFSLVGRRANGFCERMDRNYLMASSRGRAHSHPMRKSMIRFASLFCLLSIGLGASGCWGWHRHDDYEHHDDHRDDHHEDHHDDHR